MKSFDKERIFIIEIEGRQCDQYIKGEDLPDYLYSLAGYNFSCRAYADFVSAEKKGDYTL